MVVRLIGKVNGNTIVFNKTEKEELWEAIIPPTLNGTYIVELEAIDDAGNVSFLAKYILTVDISAISVKLELLEYIESAYIKEYTEKLSLQEYNIDPCPDNYFALPLECDYTERIIFPYNL